MTEPIYSPGDVLVNSSGKPWFVENNSVIDDALQITDGITEYYLCKKNTKRPVEMVKLATLKELVEHWNATHS